MVFAQRYTLGGSISSLNDALDDILDGLFSIIMEEDENIGIVAC